MRPHARSYGNPISTSRLGLAGIFFAIAVACGFSDSQPERQTEGWDEARKRMVDMQLIARDIRDTRVIDAMLKVPRPWFVPRAIA